MFILNTHIIYHATPSLIMHELWLIITDVFHYHKLQRKFHLLCLAHKARAVSEDDMIPLPSYHYLDVFNTLLAHNNNKLRPPETIKEAYTHL